MSKKRKIPQRERMDSRKVVGVIVGTGIGVVASVVYFFSPLTPHQALEFVADKVKRIQGVVTKKRK
jgi:hypothetical protein